MRKTLVKLGEKELKGEYLFDGTMLFATRRLDGTVINVKDPAVSLFMDLLIDGQISSFCPNQHGGKLLTVVMLHKVTQSLRNFKIECSLIFHQNRYFSTVVR
mgnify:CR=1 FL=1